MIRRDHRLDVSERERMDDAARARIAIVVADAVQTLIVGSSAAVAAVEHGSEWRLLAQRGPLDLSSSWRQLVARHDRGGDVAPGPGDPRVIPFPSPGCRVVLVLVPVAGISLPAGVPEIVRPILDAGRALLGAAGPAAPGDRAVLRLVGDADLPGTAS